MAVLLGGTESIRDCYVNSAVDRVWHIVKGDLTEWSITNGGTEFLPKKRLLIGTPGIGKLMAAGSYLLYELLQYDVEKLQGVAYLLADRAFLFDKTTRTMSEYMGEPETLNTVGNLSDRGVRGYIIYDVAEKGRQPSIGLPCKGWGMILVTSPNINNYQGWASHVSAGQISINCPDKNDVKAMCAWAKHDANAREQEKYWKMV
ncbi:putative retrotransposon hot spot (RHS) protein [Trypanosoma cruzi]|uniref:Putative retrotransposon hot spot (RHS) protein n=1 Tax=Trypanosoma cruzi TaxID=5693 RepID=A0A2V2WDG5_TRYCR|nr:putative retrotransposon hot spot (RHS) protein [Trypanosoma cruzi]